MTNDNIEALLSQILDKLNRVEANVAQIKQDPSALKNAVDEAIAKLGVSLNAPQR